MSDTQAFVLDASALLALFLKEPGGSVVEAAADRALISAVNWSEVVQKLLARAVDVVGLREEVDELGIVIASFTADDAEVSAVLGPSTRHLGLSLADRACLALGRRLDVPVLTADRTWLGAELGVEIRSIR